MSVVERGGSKQAPPTSAAPVSLSDLEIPHGYCHCGCGQRTRLAPRTHRRDGHVKGEPLRYIRGHHKRLYRAEYTEEDRGFPTPCWIWQKATRADGYGAEQGRLAHRSYYERCLGPIPEGLHVDHLCGVRLCVNPDHLEAVTPVVNARRSAATKLTERQVRVIRRWHRIFGSDVRAPTKRLADRFGVSKQTIRHILRGKTWVGVE